MHVIFRESHGLAEAGSPQDLGQEPADLVVLSFSDSDLGAFARGWREGREGLPSLRLANIAALAHPLSVDTYCEKTLVGAKAILVRLLGGLDYWPYGIEQLRALAQREKIALAVIPADGRPDTRLDAASNLPVSTLRRLAHLCDHGGETAARAALAQLALAGGLYADPVMGVKALAPVGLYDRRRGVVCPLDLTLWDERPVVPVVFYRSFLAAADTQPIDMLLEEMERKGFNAIGLFAPSLKEPGAAAWVRRRIAALSPDVIVNATAFSARGDASQGSPFDVCDAPVLQVALAGSDRKAWAEAERGLSPTDLAMHVVLPEVDGRIFAGVVSFKEQEARDPDLGFSRRAHCGDAGKVEAIVARVAARSALRRKSASERRIGIVLSTYPGREDQLAHALGLDALASTASTCAMLAEAGYDLPQAPRDAAQVLASVAHGEIRWPVAEYERAFAGLDPALREEALAAWGAPGDDPAVREEAFVFRATRFGKVTIALQPERGDARERAAQYHDLSRPPRHAYIAFYLWLRAKARLDALVHMGAHGTLEWLPGKSVALSQACWPEALTGAIPVVYPFIVNDPGEAATAKRRLGALTIGHMTPPVRSGVMPDGLHTLERLLDEYSTADGLDPRRRDRLVGAILQGARDCGVDRDIALDEDTAQEEAVARIDAFVCDVKETQFTDGLHVFGEMPAGAADPAMPFAACAKAERAALLCALAGRAVAPGPAGSPWRGRDDVLPTGRNLFAVDPRAVPSRVAVEQGVRMADILVTRHLQEHGDYPNGVVVDLWGSATMRTAGEDFAMALRLIGVAPTWDMTSDRVSGFEIVPLALLGRPRIDVTLRISGLFRDVFPGLASLFEQAVAALRKRSEPAGENPFNADAHGDPRVFGPAPGLYGVGIAHGLDDVGAEARDQAGRDWLANSGFAYGGGSDGMRAETQLRRRTSAADAYVHTQDLTETDILSAPDYALHQGGFAAAARLLGGSAPALYHLDATRLNDPRLRTLAEETARLVRGRASNPQWIAGQMRHGYRGATEIASTLDHMALFASLADAVQSHHFDLYYDATLGDDAVSAFLRDENPAALDAMRARFQSMIDHGHWQPLRNSIALALAPIDQPARRAAS
jgi:cobaltochelatase CobN